MAVPMFRSLKGWFEGQYMTAACPGYINVHW